MIHQKFKAKVEKTKYFATYETRIKGCQSLFLAHILTDFSYIQ